MDPILRRIRRLLRGKRVVFLGVGDRGRGDDGFGPAFVRSLQDRGLPEGWEAYDAGTSPERWTGVAARSGPDAVVFVDAAAMGCEPGTVDIVPAEEASGWGVGTHGIALASLAEWLRRSSGIDTLLLAVEPRALGRGEGLSPEVSRALRALVEALTAGRE